MSTNLLVHPEIVQRFTLLRSRERLAHAYLFIGPSEIGKFETAWEVARLINCETVDGLREEACGQCSSCKKIDGRMHPDVHALVAESNDSIKIEQVRTLLGQAQLRPYEGFKKIFIIKNVEVLTAEGGNALLKTLEEPSASSLLLLTTAYPERVLETIKSRCHVVPFLPVPKTVLAEELSSYYHVDQTQAKFLSSVAEGSSGKAKRLNEEGFIEFKDEVIDRFVLSPNSDDFLKKLQGDKDQTKVFLMVLQTWVRDCILVKAGVEDLRLIHQDRIGELKNFTKRFTYAELNEIYDEIVDTSRFLMENFNTKIPLILIKERLWAKS